MKIYIKDKKLEDTWKPWFAWHPVQLELASGKYAWVWLETVERREAHGYGGYQWRHRERVL